MNHQDTYVEIRTGDYAGLVGKAGRQFGTGIYVELRGVGLVLCRIADLRIIDDRRV